MASARVRPTTPCLDAVYATTGVFSDVATSPYIEATLMITPRLYRRELQTLATKRSKTDDERTLPSFPAAASS